MKTHGWSDAAHGDERDDVLDERGGDVDDRGHLHEDDLDEEDPLAAKDGIDDTYNSTLDHRTRRKLDWILLPFLALLFLLNSLDKSNIGNAETAGFTHDAGLQPGDLNESMGYFFAFFVALQPVGAALGRKYGMTRWVPACMSLWGCCTLLHIWVRKRWQLILLRIAIAVLEAGFYPTTVSYLSLFYTRYEFAVRLGVFYGQTAVAGVLGGVLSWAVFSRFERPPDPAAAGIMSNWRSWEVLFLIEGCLTIIVAMTGFIWLPRSADSAWFFNAQERGWAERRIKIDYENASDEKPTTGRHSRISTSSFEDPEPLHRQPTVDDDNDIDPAENQSHHRLLSHSEPLHRIMSTATGISVTADAGLTRHDILSAVLNLKVWHLLLCNILSAIPATAFSVFLPLVMKQLSPSLNLSPSTSNLLAAPPFALGALTLFLFTAWSDRSEKRLVPIFFGLALLILGLTATVLTPISNYILRYIALCILLSGSFIASPLTVAWLTNNTPEPGKRAIVLGINGWGNLAGVFLSVLFTPQDRVSGYVRPFAITLVSALGSLAGYVGFWAMVRRENRWREGVVATWSESEKVREEVDGDVPVPVTGMGKIRRGLGVEKVWRVLGWEEGRRGDEKMTFRYGL